MEVKDLGSKKDLKEIKAADRQRPAKNLAVPKPASDAIESVKIQIAKPFTSDSADTVREANDLIGMVNLVSEAASEIGKFVESLDGIAEQAENNANNPTRVAALEKEANELLDEIKKKVTTKSDDGAKLFSGDKIRLDLEKKLGKTLEVILPDAEVGLDISEFRFTPKEIILNVRENIERARARVKNISDSLSSVKSEVEATLKSLDIASENSEASESSVRDVDQAFSLVERLSQSIPADTKEAYAANRLTASSLKLLE